MAPFDVEGKNWDNISSLQPGAVSPLAWSPASHQAEAAGWLVRGQAASHWSRPEGGAGWARAGPGIGGQPAGLTRPATTSSIGQIMGSSASLELELRLELGWSHPLHHSLSQSEVWSSQTSVWSS